MFRLRTVVPLVALASLAAAPFVTPTTKGKPRTEKQCEELVKQLVNPDKPPFSERSVLKLSGVTEKDLRKKQEKIRRAYNELNANVEAALPVLIKYIDDERFSYVYEDGWSGAYVKQSVGGACREILFGRVELYHQHTTSWSGPPFSSLESFIYKERGGLEKWWQKRKGKPLADLQLEALEWAIRQPQPKHFKSKEKWDKAVKELEEMAREIRTSKKPYAVKNELWFFGK
jgi:hypothetical protein